MNESPAKSVFVPPHLSMGEYVAFIESSIREINPIFAAHQKRIEEQITHPFCISTTPHQHLSGEEQGKT